MLMEKMINPRTILLFVFLSLIFGSTLFGQNPDIPKKPDPSMMVDTSLIPKDTTKLQPWEIVYADTLQKDTAKKEPQLKIRDSLNLFFLSDRFNLASQFDRSYGHDAGDYIRFNPSNFSTDYQPFPLRKTVSPFGLPGNRIDVILGDKTLHPLEHLPEPDNQIGFEEIPTAPVQEIYNIEGPLGRIFGGDNSTASLIMIPVRPKSARAESELVVDVGNLGYSNTKAVYTEQKKSGRLIQLAAEYRRSDGFDNSWGDSTYHHWANIIYPINNKLNLNLNGRLFRRRGIFPLRLKPDFSRNRRDRDFSASFDYSFSPRNKSSLGIRHQQSETETGLTQHPYHRDIDIIDNSINYTHEAIWGKSFISFGISMTEEEYHNFSYFKTRHRGKFNSILFWGDSTMSFAGNIIAEKVGGFDPAPSAVFAYKMERESFYLSISTGFVTKFPRQYELDLTPQIDRFLAPATNDYYESGNVYLEPEKQLSGNLTISLGPVNNDLTISATGGKIIDGIDWKQFTLDTNGLSLTAFKTKNHDIEYANLTITKKILLGKKMNWTGAGTYRYLSVAGNENAAYAPDYQLRTGLELYHYLSFLEMDIYGYIEAGYDGPYKSYPAFGNSAVDLGEKIVTNLKLSFSIKSFRFYYYWQNLLATDYEQREDYGIRDMLVYYGFTWQFID